MASEPNYKWVDLERIEKLAAEGVPKRDVARLLGVSPDTWYRVINNGRSDIADAYERGKAKNCHVLSNTLMKAALKGNITATIFMLKARHGWRENINLSLVPDENGAPSQINLEITKMTREERQKEIERLTAKKQGATE